MTAGDFEERRATDDRPIWESLSAWWREEVARDPAYDADITPLVLSLLDARAGERILDVGCGEGRLMAMLSQIAQVSGVDISQDLLNTARLFGPVARIALPELQSVREGVFDGAVVCLVAEHIEDERALMHELGRVVRAGGRLAVVINHPVFTAPGSAPIEEADEVLWRPGTYFDRGYTDEPTGKGMVRFYHRTLSDLLDAASDGGWDLRRLVEMGATDSQVEQHPPLASQRHIPRLLGGSWVRRD